MKLRIEEIRLTGWNARTVKQDDPKVIELAANIKELGLIQAIVVRPSTTVFGKFDLVCGERRFTAHKVAELETIEAEVKELTDEQVKRIMLAENAEREDLTIFEEADAINMAMEDASVNSYDDVAMLLGWTSTRVKRRALIRNLTPKIQGIAEKFSIYVGALELIAALPPDLQDGFDAFDLKRMTSIKAARDKVDDALLRLRGAPFKLDDDTFGNLPACTICPKRTGCAPDLFSDKEKDQAKDNRCMDPECFSAKVDQTIARLREKFPKLPLYCPSYNNRTDFDNVLINADVDQWPGSKAVKTRVICVYGDKAGKRVSVALRKKAEAKAEKTSDAKSTEPAKMTKKEAIETLKEKRLKRDGLLHKEARRLIHCYMKRASDDPTMGTLICEANGKIDEHALLGLSAIVGISLDSSSRASEYMKSFDIYMTDGTVKARYDGHEDHDKIVLQQMKRKIFSSFFGTTAEVTGEVAMRQMESVKGVCKIACLEYENFVDQAKETQKPEPKGWDSLKFLAGEDAGEPLSKTITK